jgi:hypothetical protein
LIVAVAVNGHVNDYVHDDVKDRVYEKDGRGASGDAVLLVLS